MKKSGSIHTTNDKRPFGVHESVTRECSCSFHMTKKRLDNSHPQCRRGRRSLMRVRCFADCGRWRASRHRLICATMSASTKWSWRTFPMETRPSTTSTSDTRLVVSGELATKSQVSLALHRSLIVLPRQANWTDAMRRRHQHRCEIQSYKMVALCVLLSEQNIAATRSPFGVTWSVQGKNLIRVLESQQWLLLH